MYSFFFKIGVGALRESYQAVVDELRIDTIILADGGTDSLMCGNEEELGTPTEDMVRVCIELISKLTSKQMSIAAVNGLKHVQQKLLTNLGFGVDCFHGIALLVFFFKGRPFLI